MRTAIGVLAWILMFLTAATTAAEPELAGNWVGQVDTNRGQMEIGLSLKVEKDTLRGVLKTGHGDWEITSVVEKDGVWTVAFKGAGNEGRMVGRVKGSSFSGEWKSKMADGTFELTRAKRKSGD